MLPVASRNQILFVASDTHDKTILYGKDRVLHAVYHQKPAAWAVQHAGVQKTELGPLICIRLQGGRPTISELVRQRIRQCEGVLHLVLGPDPLGVEHVVTATALCNHSKEALGMRVGDTHCIITAGTNTTG